MEPVNAKRRCPKCKKGTLDYRTPRGFLVRSLLFWLPIKRYRCGNCNRKTYVYCSPKPAAADPNKMGVIKPD